MNQKSNGTFTLSGLLVVMAISGLLAAMLLAGGDSGRRLDEARLSGPALQVFEEITSVQPLFRSPTADFGGKHLAYIQAVERGRRLFLVNLESLDVHQVETTNEVSQVFGWSPDDRFLAFAEVSPFLLEATRQKGEFQNETWLRLYDVKSGHSERVTTNRAVVESGFAWLGTNTYFFSSKPLGKDYAQKYVGHWEQRTRRQVYNYVSEFVLISSNRAAFVQKGNIARCVLDAPKYPPIEAVSHFPADAFDSLRWLRYDRQMQHYYFCARPKGSNWRYLFRFDPERQELKQLTDEDTYNGQLLGASGGYAYVRNTNNAFSITVQSRDAASRTNLFGGGSVVNYTVSPDGNRVYATAAVGLEPYGLWEYDTTKRTLRQLVAATNWPFAASRIVEPREHRYKAEDGVEVPYFVLSPAGLAKAGTRSRKSPVILFLPAATWQFQRAFELQSQLMANLGFYYVAVNYRGCDGYGRNYASLQDTRAAAQDIVGILKTLARDPKVDARNVFLWSNSSGSAMVHELLEANPGRWRGAIIDHPGGWPSGARTPGKRQPPLLFVSGDQDRFLPSVAAFVAWARTNQMSADLMVQTNCGHLNWKTTDNRAMLHRVVEFCLANQK